MNKILVWLIILLSFFVLFRVARRSRLLNKIIQVQPVEQTPTTTNTNPTESPVVNQVNEPSTSNPFGVMISGNTSQTKVQTAVKLGAKYYRPISVFLYKWQGTCAECDVAVQGGLKLILTIRNN